MGIKMKCHNFIRAVILGSMIGAFTLFPSYAEEVTLIDPFNLESVTVLDTITIKDNDYNVSEDSLIILTSLLDENVYNSVEEVSQMEDELRNKELIEKAEEDKYTYLGKFRLTSYCGCRACNGIWTGYPTASGTDYVFGRTIAVDKNVIPLGTWIEINIPGQGWQKFHAEDTGSAIQGNDIDVYVDTHADCYQAQYNCYADVRVINEV